jgi:N6-L-threonylcarbamoyladenine synthase
MINSDDFNFSFSGLKTALLYKIKKDKNWQKEIPKYCYEFQQAVVDVLVEKTIQAAKEFKVKTILLAGGVAANKKLRRQLAKKLKKDLSVFSLQFPSPVFCTDNAAMIAVAGYFHSLRNDFTPWQKLKMDPNLEL